MHASHPTWNICFGGAIAVWPCMKRLGKNDHCWRKLIKKIKLAFCMANLCTLAKANKDSESKAIIFGISPSMPAPHITPNHYTNTRTFSITGKTGCIAMPHSPAEAVESVLAIFTYPCSPQDTFHEFFTSQ